MPPRGRKMVVAEQEEEGFGWSSLTKYVELKHISAILVVVAALLFYFHFESDVDGAFNSVQEKQMWADAVRSTPAFVERPDVEAMLSTLVTRHDARYALVLGEKASGKSTMLMKVASETSGCYYLALKQVTDAGVLVKALANALRVRSKTSLALFVYRYLAVPDLEQNLTLISVMDAIEKAAIEAKANGKKYALIIDDINLMERDDESSKALAILQQRAKSWADRDWLNVVFVASDFTAFDRMSAISASSRMQLKYIGDLSREQAISYMQRRINNSSLNVSEHNVRRAVDSVGYRFGELKELIDNLAANMTVDAAVGAIYNLRDVELSRLIPFSVEFNTARSSLIEEAERSVATYRCLHALLEANGAQLPRHSLVSVSTLGGSIVDTLLGHNILAFHLKDGEELVVRPHSIAMKAVIERTLVREQEAFEEVEKRLSKLTQIK